MRRPDDNEIRAAIRALRALIISNSLPLEEIFALGMTSDALAWTLGEPQFEVDGDRTPSFAELIKNLAAVPNELTAPDGEIA